MPAELSGNPGLSLRLFLSCSHSARPDDRLYEVRSGGRAGLSYRPGVSEHRLPLPGSGQGGGLEANRGQLSRPVRPGGAAWGQLGAGTAAALREQSDLAFSGYPAYDSRSGFPRSALLCRSGAASSICVRSCRDIEIITTNRRQQQAAAGFTPRWIIWISYPCALCGIGS